MTIILYPAMLVAALPVDVINKLLGTELEPGNAWLSQRAHEHIALDHAEDYPAVMAGLVDLVTNPGYIGQDIRHAERFVMIRRFQLSAAKNILLAVRLQPNKFGNYHICSSYAIRDDQIESRRKAKTLFVNTGI